MHLPTSTNLTHPKYRPDIDGLRALAVGCVLVFHGFPGLLPGGFIGVDVFFVISGFLISTIILKSLAVKKFSIWHFYERRIRRLFPVLVVVLLFTLAVGWWLLPPGEYATVAKHTVGGAAFVANLVLAADSGYFSDVSDSNPLLHLWSLGIEEQFYLLWPLILWFFYWRRWPLIIGIVVCIGASFAYSIYLTQGNLKLAFYLPFSRFWEMMAGAALAWVALQPWGTALGTAARWRVWAHGVSVAALALFLFAVYWLNPLSPFPGWRAALPVVAGVLFIMAGPHAVVNKYLFSNRLMVWVGLISYPLYLWHWPLLAYFHGFSYSIPAAWHSAIIAGLLALSVLLAWLSYRYVETPLRGGEHGRLKLIGLLGSMLAVTAFALWLWLGGGAHAVSRSPEAIRDLLSAELRTPAWVATLREGECHNTYYTHPADLNMSACLPSERPSLVLWGDSHAASLYSAFKAWGDENGIAIGQITTDATGPYINADQSNNMGRNYEQVAWAVINQLKAQPPSVLLLHAFWVAHADGNAEFIQPLIENVVAHLGIHLPETKVVVLGPVPAWKAEIGPNVFNYAALYNDAVIPAFTGFGLDSRAQQMDEVLSLSWAQHPTINYIAPTRYLCITEGCLFRLPDTELNVANLAYVDSSHLNTGAAHWLVERISPLLLPLFSR